jgi:hypothetical protein
MPKEIFVLAIVTLTGGFALVATAIRAFVRLKTQNPPTFSRGDERLDQIAQQLALLQQSVDATSIEVERLGEGLRFTTKVLAERNQPAAELRQPGKVVTPH